MSFCRKTLWETSTWLTELEEKKKSQSAELCALKRDRSEAIQESVRAEAEGTPSQDWDVR